MAVMTAKAVRHLPVLERETTGWYSFDWRHGEKRYRGSEVHYRTARTFHSWRPVTGWRAGLLLIAPPALEV